MFTCRIYPLIFVWIFVTPDRIHCEIHHWWKDVVLYQVYPRSFKDTNGDGVGDLPGIIEVADHFSDIGVGAVLLSPIYKSPMTDFGYDVSDFKQIDPVFGTMENFKQLKNMLKSQGIRLLMDFTPNYSSDQHEWFKKSIIGIHPYSDYYIWAYPAGWLNATTPIPPNNWISLFEGSAWQYMPERKQYYLHQYAVGQPDLNYRNKELKREIKNVLKFWLDLGVDGFRVNSVSHLFEDMLLRNEPLICDEYIIPGWIKYSCIKHIYTRDLPEAYQLVQEFRSLLDEYTNKDGISRVMLTEAYTSLEKTIMYYGTDDHPGAHMPFNFFLLTDLTWRSNATDFQKAIHKVIEAKPKGKSINWVIGNHDNSRAATRYGENMVDAMHMITMLLPGIPVTYNGEEIGMTDAKIRWDETVDVQGLNAGPDQYEQYSRDPERTPFQWNKLPNGGFSNASNQTWLPVHSNFWNLNLENQKSASHSHYKTYRRLTRLRTKELFRKGELTTYIVSNWVFAFTRTLPGSSSDICVVIANLGSHAETISLKRSIPSLDMELRIHTPSINSEYNIDDTLDAAGFSMRQKSSLVILAKISESTTVTSPTTNAETTSITSGSTDTTNTNATTDKVTTVSAETTTVNIPHSFANSFAVTSSLFIAILVIFNYLSYN